MAHIIEMPKLSDTMEEGGVANWLKKEGDFVEDGEALVEIETDKATMEYTSPEEGVLVKIIAQAGNTVALNAPIAILADKDEKVDVDALLKEAQSSSSAPATSTESADVATSEPETAPSPAATTPSQPVKAAQSVTTASDASGRQKASPLAKKIAKEKGIDLRMVQGTGPSGRIISRDLENYQPGVTVVPSVGATRADQEVPLSMMRKTIAKRLTSAKNEAPHFYLTVSCNMVAAMKWRAEINKGAEKQDRVSVNDLIVLTCAKALQKHPEVNASYQGDKILQWGGVHVAVAVALPTGLVTPVLRNTDHMGLRQISAQTKDLVKKAKDGALSNEDYAGGTFTISNLGMFGIEEFTAIINPPQAAILAVGATKKVPAVNEETNEITVEHRMQMTMSCDHRVVDGAVGAQFLKTLVTYLENPVMMLS